MSNRIPFLKNIDRMYFYDRAMMPSKKKKQPKNIASACVALVTV